MKLKENYVLRPVADTWVALPLEAETLNFNGMLTLNESGVLLWKALEKGGDREALADALMAEYIVDRETALADADAFLEKLRKVGCLE
jgi:hypothetical protein